MILAPQGALSFQRGGLVQPRALLGKPQALGAVETDIVIDGDQLARLYGVPISECLIMNPEEEEALQGLVPADATHLHIRLDGDYPQCF